MRQVQSQLQAAGLDALLVSTPHNLTYLCGFKGSAGYLFVASDRLSLLTDGRYTAAVKDGIAAGTIAAAESVAVTNRYDVTVAEVVSQRGYRVVGFEAEDVTVAALRGWQTATPAVDWRATDGWVERQRMIKDDVEVAILREAGRRLAGVSGRLTGLIAPGLTEIEVARAIDRAIEAAGFERPAFETIVASGPNSAYPHARPTSRQLARDEVVLLDFGGVLEGYCVDLTRMAVIGHIPAAIEPLFDAVHAAQQAAIDATRSGTLSSHIDRAARRVLEARGLGAAFNHGTGHGLGRDVHELPRITRAESTPAVPLEPGMVFTIEPGAYVEGVGGVRLEDDVLVTADGCEILTDAPRQLLSV